ncbi:MAG TPA: acylphosphatase [Spirochaetota bacterium]|nr:acylphosphatase [Spirochaetota bacterium]
MAKKLILHGRVQGVFCRAYCSQYARERRIRGTASNLSDGTVRVILNTDDMELVNRFIADITTNPQGFTFYGRIVSVDVADHSGPISGDYQF